MQQISVGNPVDDRDFACGKWENSCGKLPGVPIRKTAACGKLEKGQQQ